MASRERTHDRAMLRARDTVRRLGAELRTTRMASGRSQQDVALASRISQSQLARIEHGENRTVSVEVLTVVAAVVGLDLVTGAYPGPRILRDAGQTSLLRGFRERLGDEWIWRYEVRVGPGGQQA